MNIRPVFGYLWETTKTLVVVVLLALIIRTYLVQPFIVDGHSMVPTYQDRDYLIIDKLSLRFRPPRRGEVLVFRYPKDPSENYIKRVVGLPGDTIDVNGDTVKITNAAHPEGAVLKEPYINHDKIGSPYPEDITFTLTTHQYFVMGDNRHASSDSRYFGPLDDSYILGRPLLRLFPFSAISVVAAATDPFASGR